MKDKTEILESKDDKKEECDNQKNERSHRYSAERKTKINATEDKIK